MSAVEEWESLMGDTVTHKSVASRDRYGDVTLSTGDTYSARIVYQPTEFRGAGGEVHVGDGTVYLASTAEVDPEDEITLPGGETPRILTVIRVSDEDGGTHHSKIIFGSGKRGV